MWYVIQTETGQEENALLFINQLLQREKMDSHCFVLKAEWMKRLGGEWGIQIRPLFPGYVFINTDEPEQLFIELKTVPKWTKLLGDGSYGFIPLEQEEEQFFRLLLKQGSDTICLTTVETSLDGEIIAMDGPLRYLKQDILQINLHKRYAVVTVKIMGKERTAALGIRLAEEKM